MSENYFNNCYSSFFKIIFDFYKININIFVCRGFSQKRFEEFSLTSFCHNFSLNQKRMLELSGVDVGDCLMS